jgi:hypothetical protein
MARCEQGYLCDVCGEEVTGIRESDLYLRFVTGELDARQLLSARERHLRCNPVTAQFIDDAAFEPVRVDGDFDKQLFDPAWVAERTELITRGWRRLQELGGQTEAIPLADYPLREFRRPG